MEQKRDLAITLKWVAFEERHRVVTALTENHGKISALARNSIQSRRFGGALEPFAAAEWFFVERPGADLFRVEQAQIRRSFEGILRDFTRLSLASAFNELMLRVAPERVACPDLFRLHSNALASLEEADEVERPGFELMMLNAYMVKVLQWAGHQPQIQCCLGCQRSLTSLDSTIEVTCQVAEAGWLCGGCTESESGRVQNVLRAREGFSFDLLFMRVLPIVLDDINTSLHQPIRQAVKSARAPHELHCALFGFLEALFIYHLPGFDRTPLKSVRFLGVKSRLG